MQKGRKYADFHAILVRRTNKRTTSIAKVVTT
jgi:hypothetical protein